MGITLTLRIRLSLILSDKLTMASSWDTTRLDQQYGYRPRGWLARSDSDLARAQKDRQQQCNGPKRQEMILVEVEPYCGPRSILIGFLLPCICCCPVDERRKEVMRTEEPVIWNGIS